MPFMLSVTINSIMLNVIMLNVITLNVVAPFSLCSKGKKEKHKRTKVFFIDLAKVVENVLDDKPK